MGSENRGPITRLARRASLPNCVSVQRQPCMQSRAGLPNRPSMLSRQQVRAMRFYHNESATHNENDSPMTSPTSRPARRASLPGRFSVQDQDSMQERISLPGRLSTVKDRVPMLTMRPNKNDRAVPVNISVSVFKRWYTQQEVLKVQNHNSDIKFRFMCSKATVILGPGEYWEHAFIRHTAALRTMDGLLILNVWRGERLLFGNEVKLVMQHNGPCSSKEQIDSKDSSSGTEGIIGLT